MLIQKNAIVTIELINYGRWTGNEQNQHFIDTIDRGLNLIVMTVRSVE